MSSNPSVFLESTTRELAASEPPTLEYLLAMLREFATDVDEMDADGPWEEAGRAKLAHGVSWLASRLPALLAAQSCVSCGTPLGSPPTRCTSCLDRKMTQLLGDLAAARSPEGAP